MVAALAPGGSRGQPRVEPGASRAVVAAAIRLGRRRRTIRLSPTLSRYIARHVLVGIGIAIFGLAMLALMIDTVELLRRAADRDDATLGVVLRMALLHLPFLAQKLLPFAVLFGTMFSFQRLTRSHELIAARSVGVSVWQFLLPAILVAAGLGTFVVVAFNPLASAMVARYEQLDQSYFSSHASLATVSGSGIWLRQAEGGDEVVIHARQMTRDPPVLETVVVFFYDEGVHFVRRADAPTARLEPGHWKLIDPVVVAADGSQTSPEELLIPTDLTAGGIQENFAPPETMSFWELPHFIDSLEAVGFSAREHRLYWHGLLALPLLLSAMLVIGTAFSLRLARHGGTGLLVAAGLVAGFAFYILSDLVFAIGLSGQLPVALAAWTPAGIAILLGVATLFYLEDG
jgi:lipopolysaccharide export system permease protein